MALRRTLQQVQEDLSALQKDQRQLDDITRGIQRDLDEAQPRDTLRFLEEHFTCALCAHLLHLRSRDNLAYLSLNLPRCLEIM